MVEPVHAPVHAVWSGLMSNLALQLLHMTALFVVHSAPVLGAPFVQSLYFFIEIRPNLTLGSLCFGLTRAGGANGESGGALAPPEETAHAMEERWLPLVPWGQVLIYI